MLKRLVSHSMNLAGGSSPASASAQHPGSWPSTRHRRGILQSSIQYSQNRRLETRQIVLNGMPDHLDIDPVVLMPKPIANSPNVPPWLPWTEPFGFITQAHCSFADEQHLALDSRYGFWIRPKRIQIHSRRELFDADDGFDDIAKRESGFPKRQGRPLARLWPLPDPSGTSLETGRRGHRAYRRVGFRLRPCPKAIDGVTDRTQR